MKNLRDPLVAGGLSAVVPGAGQIYNQEVLKGWIVLILFCLLAGTVFGAFAVWGAGIADAYFSAKKINRGDRRISPERDRRVAVLNSVVCGWGQIYNGETLKGGLMLACLVLLAPTGIGLVFMWIYGAADAYYTAGKINRGEIETPFIKGYIYHRLDDLHELLEEEPGEILERVEGRRYLKFKDKSELAFERGDYVLALDHGRMALENGGESDFEVHRLLGKIYFEAGNYGFAVLEFIRAFETGDRGAALYNNLGLSVLNYVRGVKKEDYIYLGELCFEKAFSLDEGLWQAEVNYVNLLIEKEDFGRAFERCSSFVENNPGIWQGKHCLGLIYLEEKRLSEAKEIFQEVLSHYPEAWETRISLGRLYEEERDEREALSVYRELMRAPERIKRGADFRMKRLNLVERKVLRGIRF